MKGKWKYEIIIYWSEEDRAYIAEVPELPGCAADVPTGPGQRGGGHPRVDRYGKGTETADSRTEGAAIVRIGHT